MCDALYSVHGLIYQCAGVLGVEYGVGGAMDAVGGYGSVALREPIYILTVHFCHSYVLDFLQIGELGESVIAFKTVENPLQLMIFRSTVGEVIYLFPQ